MNEVPTYTPPEGVHGPTLGRDLPDGCERLRASIYPNFRDEWWDGPGVTNDCLYWWRTVPLAGPSGAPSSPVGRIPATHIPRNKPTNREQETWN
ncbi:MAG: hypothetical protein KA758_15835 [Acidimicrobiales bacterium]|nr:hypothetical protein [Acidimicrobiales bacterium]